MDFLRTAQRETAAALRLLKKASHRHGVPATIPMDGRDAKEAASKRSNAAPGTPIAIGQVPYLHHIVEQDHRGGKRITRPLVGFKAFDAAPATLVGSALMHLITKRQLVVEEGQEGRTTAEWFDSRAA